MRARAALLSGLAVLAGLQLGLTAFIKTRRPDLHNPGYGCRATRLKRRLRAGAQRPCCVVMLGTSRTYRGLRGAVLEGALARELGRPVVVCNFGVDGAGPVTQLLNWGRLRRDGIRPDLLLIEVLPPSLAGQHALEETAEALHPTETLWWADLVVLERYGGGRRVGTRLTWAERWAVPFYTYRRALLSRLAPQLVPFAQRLSGQWDVDECGCPPPLSAEVLPERRQYYLRASREGYRPFFAGYRVGGPGCAALEELLAACRGEGVPAALVLMPEGPVFRSWYPSGAWEEALGWVRRLGARHGVPLLDAREWAAEEEFIDSHHLNGPGAERFTERLGRELVLPLLRERSAPGRTPRRGASPLTQAGSAGEDGPSFTLVLTPVGPGPYVLPTLFRRGAPPRRRPTEGPRARFASRSRAHDRRRAADVAAFSL